MDPTQPLESPFWAFSLDVYGAPGVAEECLGLQERLGLDVNLLLLTAYMGAVEGVTLEASDLAAAAGLVAAWHDGTVRALRAVRRALKPPSLDAHNPLHGAASALRLQVKAAELESEKIEQAMLWRWSRTRLAARNRAEAQAALAANLHTLLAHAGAPGAAADKDLPRLQAATLAFAKSKS
jgi:uncharacterized protein (TIGR02444 family)